jgi:hypothetical protein
LSSETTDAANETGGTGYAADADSDYCGDAMDTWMISPVMDFSGYSTITLQFKSDFWDYNNRDDGFVDISTDGGATWTNLLHYEHTDYYGPRTETIDISSYAGQAAVTIRFHYVAPDWDWFWMVDDVVVSASSGEGKPISDVAIPAAVLPAAGNLPALAKFVTHRDTGGDTLEDLLAVEITELTVDKYGWVKGEKNQIQLAEDPTNSDPYDNLSQVWYTVVPMDEGAARLVAEITATTALDLDLYWGFDVNGDGKTAGRRGI